MAGWKMVKRLEQAGLPLTGSNTQKIPYPKVNTEKSAFGLAFFVGEKNEKK